MAKCHAQSDSCKLCPSAGKGIFAQLQSHELEWLDEYKTSNRYRKGQVIFYEGNPQLGLYFVRSGKIKVYKSNTDGKQQILRIASPGDILGHSSLFSGKPSNATAEAIEDAEVCFLDKNGFFSILKNNHSIALNLLNRLSSELIRVEEKTMDLAYKSARARFAELLLTLKESFGVPQKGLHRLDIALSREELAQAVGTTVETAVRLLTEFREEGFIEVDRKNISIVAPDKLLELTSPAY
jgi:CRP/FNR family transcriptional regulator